MTTPLHRYLIRIPVRKKDEIILLPVETLASIVSERALVHLTTITGERHTMTHSLKDLESRLDPATFVRLSRGSIVNIAAIRRVRLTAGSSYLIELTNGEEIPVARIQARVFRHRLLAL